MTEAMPGRLADDRCAVMSIEQDIALGGNRQAEGRIESVEVAVLALWESSPFRAAESIGFRHRD